MGVGSSKRFSASFAILVVLAFCSLLTGTMAHAQVTGATVTGTISDPSGGVVAGATVSATNTATAVTRDVLSDASRALFRSELGQQGWNWMLSTTNYCGRAYPAAGIGSAGPMEPSVTRLGVTHVGMVCDDLVATRSELEGRGVSFLTEGMADVAGLKTTWCHDPWGTVIILMEKRHTTRPYWDQFDVSDPRQPPELPRK